jgi:predicted hotdog family 3-hydroxylacyl-ACP dehydratase
MLSTAAPVLRDRAWIAARIPHQGRMCLLDAVLHADADTLHCRANDHRDHDHPLRQFGRLGAACGVEYAAQAIAVHGALLAETAVEGARAMPGMLVSVRGVTLYVSRLDDQLADLDIQVQRLGHDTTLLPYAFRISAAAHLLLEGRATVLLQAPHGKP